MWFLRIAEELSNVELSNMVPAANRIAEELCNVVPANRRGVI